MDLFTTKERAVNFSQAEKNRFQNLLQKYKDVLFCKKTDHASNTLKSRTWNAIYEEFNAGVEQTRTLRQLKAKFDNMKRRKDTNQNRQSHLKLGRSPPSPSREDKEWICQGMPMSKEDLPNVVDDDYIEQPVDVIINIRDGDVFDNQSPASLPRSSKSKALRVRKHSIGRYRMSEMKIAFLKKQREQEEHMFNLNIKHMVAKRREENELHELKRKKILLEISLLEKQIDTNI
ncbi:unnamed protein product [Leptosia nina]|uniref:Regulatory protein zeste n=1 Tax=Leptosia nina TaxID=320188 RepID=A0AAV1JN88_9NEOP